MVRLNPYALVQKRAAAYIEARRKYLKQVKINEKRGVSIDRRFVPPSLLLSKKFMERDVAPW